MSIISEIEASQLKENIPSFNVGDTVRVYNRIKEGNRERVQVFEGASPSLRRSLTGIGSCSIPRFHPLFVSQFIAHQRTGNLRAAHIDGYDVNRFHVTCESGRPGP